MKSFLIHATDCGRSTAALTLCIRLFSTTGMTAISKFGHCLQVIKKGCNGSIAEIRGCRLERLVLTIAVVSLGQSV
jgi:hypothetical protein